MVTLLDAAAISYTRTIPYKARECDYPLEKEGEFYLNTHLKYWIDCKIEKGLDYKTRSDRVHTVMKSNGKDLRRSLPSTINSAMNMLDDCWNLKQRVTVTWIVCYLNKIYPSITVIDWERFECSHICIEFGLEKDRFNCIDASCLTWESKSVNQSRGNNYCMRKCNHCQNWCCHCQDFHKPSCN